MPFFIHSVVWCLNLLACLCPNSPDFKKRDKEFSARVNLYDCHYNATHIMGTTGGNNDDLIEANDLAARGIIDPAIMVTHVGGLDSVADATCNLPHMPGGKKLAYTQFDMPMTAIEDFGKLGETDPFFKKLDECCKAHRGLWNPEAEKMIFEHFGVNTDELNW